MPSFYTNDRLAEALGDLVAETAGLPTTGPDRVEIAVEEAYDAAREQGFSASGALALLRAVVWSRPIALPSLRERAESHVSRLERIARAGGAGPGAPTHAAEPPMLRRDAATLAEH